jgi:acyl-CoA thioesterase
VTAIGASEFDRDTAVGDDGDSPIRAGWAIGDNANGGYLMALAARRMAAVAGRRYPLTVTGHYLLPGTEGAAHTEATVIKAGRRFSTVSAALQRDGRPMLQLLGSFCDGFDDDGPSHVAGGPPDLPPYEDCVPRAQNQGMVTVSMIGRMALRLHPDNAGFTTGERNGVAELAGWFAFADGRPVDPLALLLVGDAFPPAVFHLPLPPGWVPTIEYTVHVRGVPAPGPLACVFRSQFVQGGLLNEDGEMWDSKGRLVAQSRQLGLIARAAS